MSSPFFSPPRCASIPPPVHPSLKRQHSLTPDISPSKRRRNSKGDIQRKMANDATHVFEYPSSGWTALSVVPRLRESEQRQLEEEDSGKEIENNQSDTCSSIKITPPTHLSPDSSPEIPDSSATISPLVSPICGKAPLPTSSPSVRLMGAKQPKRSTSSPKRKNRWNIDGLDVHTVMKKGEKSTLMPVQEKKILLWMKINGARRITGHTESFNKLLADMKFTGQGHSKEVEATLRYKVSSRLATVYSALKKKGIVTDVGVNTPNCKENLKIKFADYTDTWLRPEWDGSLEMPNSWLAETVEVDHEIDECPDDASEILIVVEPPTPQEPQRPQKKATQVYETPAVDVLANIQEFWTGKIKSAMAEAEPQLEKAWNKSTIAEAEWNFAAVQAQHLEVDMSKKIILEDALDQLLSDSEVEEDSDEGAGVYGKVIFAQPLATVWRGVRDKLEPYYATVDPCNKETSSESEIEKFVRLAATQIQPRKSRESIESLHSRTKANSIELGDQDSYSEHDTDEKTYVDEGLIADMADYTDEENNADEEDNTVEEDTAELHELELDDVEMNDAEVEMAELPIDLTGTTFTFPSANLELPISFREAIAAQKIALQEAGSQPSIYAGKPYEIIPLTCATYPEWVSQLHSLLVDSDAWGVITGELQPPFGYSLAEGEAFEREWAQYEREAEEWGKKRDVCLDWMLLTMGDELRNAVTAKGIRDPAELWVLLRDEFEVQGLVSG
ncbi:hypothetical protein EG329_009555 [Mollisiaceae sp. DMI_Dod_QoI]|nr:hypothetical protein EG329_009555 [Helotiales sp. DMI_Dod_QoI]